MACTFCATGTMGLKGDLTAGEILEQVLHASRVAPIRNVVFMGESRHLKAHFRRTSTLDSVPQTYLYGLCTRLAGKDGLFDESGAVES